MQYGSDIDDKVIEDKISAQKPEDCATLIYTVRPIDSVQLLIFSYNYLVGNHWRS